MPGEKLLGVLVGLGVAGFFFWRRASKGGKKHNGAFIDYFELLPPSSTLPPNAPLPLAELTFAIKDM